MDPKLKKLFERAKPAEEARQSDVHRLVNELITAVLQRQSLVLTNLPPHERSHLLLGLLADALREKTVWYVAPSTLLTPFRLYLMKSTLGDDNLAVMTSGQMDDTFRRIVIWSADVLSSRLGDCDNGPRPDFVVIDDVEYLGHPQAGTMLEEILLCLPPSIPAALLLPAASNGAELARWLEMSRQTPCRLVTCEQRPNPTVAAFIASNWEFVPLLENKGLRGRVKRFVRETSPFANAHSGAFVRGLVTLLRAEGLTPAVVVMPAGADCDLAAGACEAVFKEIGDALTDPQVAATLDRHPLLKEHPFLDRGLTRRAAPLHAGHHPLWSEWVERFLLLDYLDIVFATPDAAETMSCGCRSVVFCTSSCHEGRRLRPLTPLRMQRIIGRLGGGATDPAACVAVAHTANIDVVHLKDLLLAPPLRISSVFRCGSRVALGLLAPGVDPAFLLKRSLSVLQACEVEDGGRFAELAAELLALLPQARCFANAETVAALVDLRYRLSMRRDELAARRSRTTKATERDRLDREHAELNRTIALFPCEECEHLPFCHKRGYKKFRELLQEYVDLRKTALRGLAGLEMDLQRHLQCLLEFDLIGPDQRLTSMGVLAHRTGLSDPQPAVELFRHGLLGAPADELAPALLGGFIEWPAADFTSATEALAAEIDELTPAYTAMASVVETATERMLRFGIAAAKPSIHQSALLLALDRGRKAAALAEQTGVPLGALARLERDAWHLLWQFRHHLTDE